MIRLTDGEFAVLKAATEGLTKGQTFRLEDQFGPGERRQARLVLARLVGFGVIGRNGLSFQITQTTLDWLALERGRRVAAGR